MLLLHCVGKREKSTYISLVNVSITQHLWKATCIKYQSKRCTILGYSTSICSIFSTNIFTHVT